MTISEKVAYLKGLAEGLNLDENAKETKLFNAMFDILEEMALTINEIDEDLATVEEYVDCIDEDLDELEEFIYEDDDFCDCGCDCCDDDESFRIFFVIKDFFGFCISILCVFGSIVIILIITVVIKVKVS